MSDEEKIIEAFQNLAEGKFEFEEVKMTFEKKTLQEIHELSKNVDADKAAEEVLTWLIENVSHFIDNKEREFRIELVIDENSGEKMENIKLLQDLYRAIPDDDEYVSGDKIAEIMASGNLNDAFEDEDFKKLVECREALDNISFEIHDQMRESDKLHELYKAMIYFYEMIGLNEGQALLRDLEGEVDIVEFEYEAFNVAVKVLEGQMGIEQDMSEECEKQVIKQYLVPEGFSLVIEIAFRDQGRALGLF